MRVGVPKEIKVLENRVGLTPESVRELTGHGHEVVVEHEAGQGIGVLRFLRQGLLEPGDGLGVLAQAHQRGAEPLEGRPPVGSDAQGLLQPLGRLGGPPFGEVHLG